MRIRLFLLIFITIISFVWSDAKDFPGKKSNFHGFVRHDFPLNDFNCIVVEPKKAAKGNPWVWRARFFGHEPQADIELLKKGFYIAYCDVSNLFGSPKAVERWNRFYDYLDREHFFNPKPALEGMSRGGLIIYNWAKQNPTKVACIYGDAPVNDIKSWPMGHGDGPGSKGAWSKCKEAYGFKSDEEALAWRGNPIDGLEPLAKAGVPLLHVVGDADKVVPVHENTNILAKRYKALGGSFELINKPGVGHHPHALKDPKPIVDFIVKHTIKKSSASSDGPKASDNHYHLRGDYHNSFLKFTQEKKGHVAFLGGSITKMEGYRPMVMDFLQKRFPETEFTFTPAGISSTCSTTGAFRMSRDVLNQGPVDLFFVEFAVNDDQDAHHDREACIRGMEGIVQQLRAHNPMSDIVMTFFMNEQIMESLKQGVEPLTPKSHTEVAEHYNIGTIHLAAEAVEQIQKGELTWEIFGGVHPKPHGNRIGAIMIEKMLTKSWLDFPYNKRFPVRRAVPRPLLENSYTKGRFISINQAKNLKRFKVGVPDWKSLKGGKRKQFNELNILEATKPGSSFEIEFTGKAIGAFLLAGPDAGILEVSVDNGPFKSFDLYHRYSKGLHYPRSIAFFHDLSDGRHKAVFRISDKTSSAGTSVRIMELCVN